ncbi:MAG: DUF1549 domain-containing protein, partial [Saprospiraceae bacterium]|nr:DUF1549 domain-containing protein [Saprospiraceae bacterium]
MQLKYHQFLLLWLLLVFTQVMCTSKKVELADHSIDSNSFTLPEKIDFIFHVKPILSDRCFKCHGPDEAKVEAGLQLHLEEKAFAALGKNKDRHAIVKGDIKNSEMVKRIFSDDPDDIMPPPESNLALSENEKTILKKWIEQGAEWKKHWAFVPPVDPKVPTVKDVSWISNPIDNFILKKLEEKAIEPSSPINDEKLLRKVSFDLTGLPPTIEDINAFINDNSKENYERIVDRYLQSDAYAERMTNEWLDLARYADTHGYQDDLERIMWPWRDWVIHAFRQNMSYDKFVTWQLAGDLIPNATKEQIIATAFNRNHKITQEGGVIPEEYRAEYVTDRTNTFGTAFLGLTFECAKCHDHKYDPISQKDYFQLFGYFNNVDEKGLIETYGAIPAPYINITKEEIDGILTFINNADDMDTIPLLVMKEVEKPRNTHVLNRGMYDQPSTRVYPSFPGFGEEVITDKKSNRLDLAEWLFSDDNPLTARVTVNRLWQQIFGKGIVETSYDFGNQGALPTHPELLDHLAIKFKNEGWDLRKMIKYMVTSSAYRQGTQINDDILNKDPENNLLARSNRSRMSAEMLRDHALAISGLLVDEIGGPSVKPYQPDGLWNEVTGGGGGSTSKYIQDEGDKNYRRSLYTFWKRTVPPPNMMLFDTPTR